MAGVESSKTNSKGTPSISKKKAYEVNGQMVITDRDQIRAIRATGSGSEVYIIKTSPIKDKDIQVSPRYPNTTFLLTSGKSQSSKRLRLDGSDSDDVSEEKIPSLAMILRELQGIKAENKEIKAENRNMKADQKKLLEELGLKTKQIHELDGEVKELQNQNMMRELYDSNFTNVFICAASLIKFIEEKILLIAKEVVERSIHLTKDQKKSLKDFWQIERKHFGMFMNRLRKNKEFPINVILREIEVQFLMENDDPNNHPGFDLARTFREFKHFWEKRNMNSVHVFDWEVNEQVSLSKKYDQGMLQARLLTDLEKKLSNVKDALPDSPYYCLKPFMTLLTIAIKNKKEYLRDCLNLDID